MPGRCIPNHLQYDGCVSPASDAQVPERRLQFRLKWRWPNIRRFTRSGCSSA